VFRLRREGKDVAGVYGVLFCGFFRIFCGFVNFVLWIFCCLSRKCEKIHKKDRASAFFRENSRYNAKC